MAEISLHAGESLRIQNGNGVSLLLRPEGASWEIEVLARRDPWWKRWLRAWREDEQAWLLARLDEHLLRDIGMGAASGNPLAARVHAYREDERRRSAMAQLGLI